MPVTRDAWDWEILWHELLHASHTADGTRVYDPNPGTTDIMGWEEVFTIEKMNKLRDWWNQCMRGERDIVTPRDPFTHQWAAPLKGNTYPSRKAPIDRTRQSAPGTAWPLERFIETWEGK